MPHILSAANLAAGAKDLSPDKGLWDRSGALWVPGKPAEVKYTFAWDTTPSFYSSFLPSLLFGLPTKATPAPDLPVQQRDMPVIGYRAWILGEKFKIGVGRRPKLKSTGVDFTWRAGTNTAKCTAAHPAPDQRCQCGLYVLASLKELEKHVTMGKNLIVGAVVGWGRVVQHGTEGWRAEHAKIVALLDCKYSEKQLERTQEIAAAYGLEIKTRPQIQSLIREYGDPVS